MHWEGSGSAYLNKYNSKVLRNFHECFWVSLQRAFSHGPRSCYFFYVSIRGGRSSNDVWVERGKGGAAGKRGGPFYSAAVVFSFFSFLLAVGEGQLFSPFKNLPLVLMVIRKKPAGISVIWSATRGVDR